MPTRLIAAQELARLCAVFAHPDRVRIVEELRAGERDVNSLQEALGVTHSRTSQNLAVLRTHRIVAERRDGRHVYYHLVQPDMAEWLVGGLQFAEASLTDMVQRRMAIEAARQVWTPTPPPKAEPATRTRTRRHARPKA